MAPRILMLLRPPVTGISGGCPTRLQVACSVESCRKLASSVKISARLWVRAFFKGWDRCADAAAQDAAGALHREAHLVQQLPHVSRMVQQLPHVSRMVGDAEFLRNHPGEHRRSPDSRVQTIGHRATFEDIPELGALLRCQTRWTTRSVALQQPIHAVSLIKG